MGLYQKKLEDNYVDISLRKTCNSALVGGVRGWENHAIAFAASYIAKAAG
jgi:hypothetical protein